MGKMKIHVIVQKGTDCFVGHVVEYPDCGATADTELELMSELTKKIKMAVWKNGPPDEYSPRSVMLSIDIDPYNVDVHKDYNYGELREQMAAATKDIEKRRRQEAIATGCMLS